VGLVSVPLAAGGLIGIKCVSQRTVGVEHPHSNGIKQTIKRMISPSLVWIDSATHLSPASPKRRDAGASFSVKIAARVVGRIAQSLAGDTHCTAHALGHIRCN
jgi:hypothetical protein